MTTNYPNQIDDTVTLPLVVDNVNKVNAEVVNRLRAAVIAVETEMGVKPSGTSGTVRTRLDDLELILNTINGLTQEITSIAEIDVSGAAIVTLTTNETAHSRLKLTGALTENVIVIVPPGTSLGWARDVWNATTGAFTLTVKTTIGGAGVAITQNEIKRLFADSANVIAVT